MPRFDFYIHAGKDIVDTHGIDVDGLPEARRAAIHVLSAYFQSSCFDPGDEKWWIDVATPAGDRAFALQTIFSPPEHN